VTCHPKGKNYGHRTPPGPCLHHGGMPETPNRRRRVVAPGAPQYSRERGKGGEREGGREREWEIGRRNEGRGRGEERKKGRGERGEGEWSRKRRREDKMKFY